MYTNILFNPVAFKHNITEDDIRWAIKTHICDVLMEGHDNKYAVIGFDTNGNLIEVMYNLINEQSCISCYAMPGFVSAATWILGVTNACYD